MLEKKKRKNEDMQGAESVIDLIAQKMEKDKIKPNTLARVLEVSSGELAGIMSRKRGIAKKVVEKLIDYLQITDAKQFRRLVMEHNLSLRLAEKQTVTKLTLDEKSYLKVASALHMTILALSKTPKFVLDAKSIAQTLNENVSVIERALEDMVNVGIILRTKAGVRFVDDYESAHDMPSAGARKINREFLEKAYELISENSASVFAGTHFIRVKKSDIPKMKALIFELTKKVCEILERDDPTEVFRLSLQFVPHSFEG